MTKNPSVSKGLSGRPISFWIEWILRISASLCFIGHGAFGIITKSDWLDFFAVFGIGSELAYTFQPLIGIMDITLGILILILPFRFVMIWMAFWAVWTAMLRPLAGRSIWEFFERAGNYGVPIALLFLYGFPRTFRDLYSNFKRLDFKPQAGKIAWVLRITTALLLIGHGGFGAFQHKQMLIGHFQSVSLIPAGMDPVTFITLIGWFEILLGLAILAKPFQWLLLLAFAWKIGTELLYPLSGDYIFEWIERFGSYGSPLALYFLNRYFKAEKLKK